MEMKTEKQRKPMPQRSGSLNGLVKLKKKNLARLMNKKGRRHKSPIPGMKWNITTDAADSKRITESLEQFYIYKFDNFDDIYQFLKKTCYHHSPNITQFH